MPVGKLYIRMAGLFTILMLASGCHEKSSPFRSESVPVAQALFSSDFAVVSDHRERFFLTHAGEFGGQPTLSLFATNGRRQAFDFVDTAKLGTAVMHSNERFAFFQNVSEKRPQVIQVPLMRDRDLVLHSLIGSRVESHSLALRPLDAERPEIKRGSVPSLARGNGKKKRQSF